MLNLTDEMTHNLYLTVVPMSIYYRCPSIVAIFYIIVFDTTQEQTALL